MTAPITFITMATQSHQRLVNEWFLPSFKDDQPINITYCDDKLSGGGEWRTPSFDSAVQRKMKVIADAVAANQGKLLVWTDVDIQFFRPIGDALIQLMQQSDSDIMFQRGHHRMREVCTGFFVTRCTKKTLFFWRVIQWLMVPLSYCGDQFVTNYTIGFLEKVKPFTQRFFNLKWSYLPDEFYGPGIDFSRIWEPGMTLNVPENPYLHHANWCIGIDNKIAQFKYVKAVLESRRDK